MSLARDQCYQFVDDTYSPVKLSYMAARMVLGDTSNRGMRDLALTGPLACTY